MNSINVGLIEEKSRDIVQEEAEKHAASLSNREADLHRGRAEGAMKLLDYLGMGDYADDLLTAVWREVLADCVPTG